MIQLRALGVLDLRTVDNAEIRQVLAQPKRAALLTYLVLAAPRGPHPRDQLLALFWPDQPTESARNALSQAVHFLRRALGDDVIVSHNGDALAIAPGAVWCDVTAFDDACGQGRTDDALALYRGDFLDGFHVANAPEFERWVDAERQRLAAALETALETVATRCEQQGDHAAALAHRRRLAARAPYNSGIALRLMRALAASGDTAAAVHYAQVHEKLLRAELDVPLPAEIAAFVAQLQTGLRSQQVTPAVAGTAVAGTAVAGTAVAGQAATPVAETVLAEPAGAPPVKRGMLAAMLPPPRSRRVAVLTTILVIASVGAAYALVVRPSSHQLRLQDMFRRGRNAEVNRSFVGLHTAMQYYRSAIARDSTFALGYAALSQTYVHMAHYDFAPKGAALDSARSLAHRAMSLDSTLAEARIALAYSLASSGHFTTAEGEFRRAIALDPDNAVAHATYGMLLVALGRGEEALDEAEVALELDPLGPRVAHSVKKQAMFLVTGKQPFGTLPPTERRPILKVETGEPWARAQQAVDMADDGRCAEARADISLARGLVPDSNRVMLAFAGIVHWQCHEPAQARALLERMKQRRDADEHAMRIAILHARMGETDSAFAWLDRHHWLMSELAMLQGAPWFDPLRQDPALARLRRRLGLP